MYGKRVQGGDRKHDKNRLAKKCGDETDLVFVFVRALSFASVKIVPSVSLPYLNPRSQSNNQSPVQVSRGGDR